MNAIILSAIWGVVMMFSGVFIKSKTIPKYLAIFGLTLVFIANATEFVSHQSFFVLVSATCLKQTILIWCL